MEQAIKIFTCSIIDPTVKWDNEYRPNQISDVEREKFFTNFDGDLLKRIRNERQSKN